MTYVDKKEVAREFDSGPKGVYNYEEGGEMKEMERGVASNVGKGVEMETKRTEGWTSIARSPYRCRTLLFHVSSEGEAGGGPKTSLALKCKMEGVLSCISM